MTTEFFSQMKMAFNNFRPFVLCTVIENIGSSPGKAGQKMIVYPDSKTLGTVGGGVNEDRVVAEALKVFDDRKPKTVQFNLDNPIDGAEPVCGGVVKLFLELHAPAPQLVIFGGGHVGKALASVASLVHFDTIVFDEREEYANNERFNGSCRVIHSDYSKLLEKVNIDKNTYLVIMTPGHLKDREVLEKVLRQEFAYCGLICSEKKKKELFEQLIEKGFDKKKVNSIFAPVGIDLQSTTPEEIAIEITAQMVAFRNGKIILFKK